MFSIPILSFLIFLPIIAIAIILTIKGDENVVMMKTKSISILTSVIHFILLLYLFFHFNKLSTYYQFVDSIIIIKDLNVSYSLGLDGLSIIFVLISSFIMMFIFAFISFPAENAKLYSISYLVLLSLSCGTFLSTDILFFFVFYEFSLVPIFFIMMSFGSYNKFYTTFKFFLYTLFSSIFLLLGIVYLISNSSSSYIPEILSNLLSYDQQKYLFWLFFIGFGIKVALFPFHTWLPDTYKSSPVSLNILLSAVIMKYGVYGFIRFVLPLFPLAIWNNIEYIYTICIVTLLYSGFIAMKNPDIKRLLAYFSMSHVALIVAGIFSIKTQSLEGAIFQSASHSVINAGLFLAVFILQKRLHSDKINDFSGLSLSMPIFSLLFFIITLSAMSFPLTNGFIGEFLILIGIFQDYRLFALLFGLSIIISAIVVINLNSKMIFSNKSELNGSFHDINKYEMSGLTIIVLLILFLGIYPDFLLDNIHTSMTILLEKIKVSMMIN